MFFFFVCGEHTFRKPVEGYEGMVCQCYNCGNISGHVIKSHPWFTFCWIVSLCAHSFVFFPCLYEPLYMYLLFKPLSNSHSMSLACLCETQDGISKANPPILARHTPVLQGLH